MYRLNLVLPWALLLSIILFVHLVQSYVIVHSEIMQAFEKYNRAELLNIAVDQNWNWYQRSAALELAFALKCGQDDPLVERLLSSNNINFRQALMKGCLRHPPEKLPVKLIEQLLWDHYSYIKFFTINYIKRHNLSEYYRGRLIELRDDSSTMVANLARGLSFSNSKSMPLKVPNETKH